MPKAAARSSSPLESSAQLRIAWVQVYVNDVGRFFVEVPLAGLSDVVKGEVIVALFHQDPEEIKAANYDLTQAMGFIEYGNEGFVMRLNREEKLGSYVRRQGGIDVRIGLPGGIRELQKQAMQ